MTYKPPPEESTNGNGTITEKTKVALPIRVLLALVGTIALASVSGSLWLNNRFDRLDAQMNRMSQTLWSLHDHQMWVEENNRIGKLGLTDPRSVFFNNRPYLIDPNSNRP